MLFGSNQEKHTHGIPYRFPKFHNPWDHGSHLYSTLQDKVTSTFEINFE